MKLNSHFWHSGTHQPPASSHNSKGAQMWLVINPRLSWEEYYLCKASEMLLRCFWYVAHWSPNHYQRGMREHEFLSDPANNATGISCTTHCLSLLTGVYDQVQKLCKHVFPCVWVMCGVDVLRGQLPTQRMRTSSRGCERQRRAFV